MLLLIAQLFSIPILTYTVVIILLLTAIAFQQELREVFLGIFGGSVLPGKKQVAVVDLHHSVIDAVCQAAVEMSRNHTGALIVLERHIKLDDVARSGVELDAKVSSYLLRNIFYDKAPLHDGAVYVRGDKILAAGCFLPLTQKLDVDKDIGTRHRAAIGVTEEYDHLAIIVSEETGIISVARGGEIERYYDSEMLTDVLEQACGLRATLSVGGKKRRK